MPQSDLTDACILAIKCLRMAALEDRRSAGLYIKNRFRRDYVNQAYERAVSKEKAANVLWDMLPPDLQEENQA